MIPVIQFYQSQEYYTLNIIPFAQQLIIQLSYSNENEKVYIFLFYQQDCNLIFGAWSYHTTKMNLTNASATINLDSYERNGEWDIETTEVN